MKPRYQHPDGLGILDGLTVRAKRGELFWLGVPLVVDDRKRLSMSERRDIARKQFRRLRQYLTDEESETLKELYAKAEWESADLRIAREVAKELLRRRTKEREGL
jgi:hypothetical protein